MTELIVAAALAAGVTAAHELGFRLGALTRSTDETLDRQVALVRTSTGALVAFLIGFASPERLPASLIGWTSS